LQGFCMASTSPCCSSCKALMIPKRMIFLIPVGSEA
jgi:hypothetical protein